MSDPGGAGGEQPPGTAQRPSPWCLPAAAAALVCFAYAHRDPVWTPACLAAMLVSYLHARTIPMALRRSATRIAVAAAVALALAGAHHATVLGAGEDLTPVLRYRGSDHVSAMGGLFLAAALAWTWHLPGRGERKAMPVLAGCGFLAVLSGDFVDPSRLYRVLLAVFYAAWLVSAALLAAPASGRGIGRGDALRRLGAVALSIGIVGAGAVGGARALAGLEAALTSPMDLGLFTRYFGLGAGARMPIRRGGRMATSQVLLATVTGRLPPGGYLRTQSMCQYSDGVWSAEPGESRRLEPEAGDKVGRLGPLPWRLRADAAVAAAGPAAVKVELVADLGGSVPLPYGARALRVSGSPEMEARAGDALSCVDSSRLHDYQVESGDSPSPGAPPPACALAGPDAVLEALRPLARELAFAEPRDALAAAAAIERHLRTSHAYSLSVDLDRHGDPIADFVLNRRPGYCEHFASALALLLRSIGIPARVAGGFAVGESGLGGSWLVRKDDAHAWCEVYDAASGDWVAFDGTPPEALAAARRSGWPLRWRQAKDWIRLRARDVVLGWQRLAAGPRLLALAQAVARSWRAWLTALVAGLVTVLLLRRRFREALAWLKRRRRAVRVKAVAPETLAAACFRRLMRALERRPRPLTPSETIEEYARRSGLEPEGLDRFARLYNRVRFGGSTGSGDAEALESLTDDLVGRLG